MVTETDTKVIDPEFAVMGPIGFDVGKLLGNLLLSFFSQRGHERHPGERDAYRAWILATTARGLGRVRRRFVELWNAYPTGDGYPRALFDGPEGEASLREVQADYMGRLFQDALGFAGAAMIRRTLGLAHNIDMETIADPDLRAACERRNLRLARELLAGAAGFPDIAAVTARAAAIEAAASHPVAGDALLGQTSPCRRARRLRRRMVSGQTSSGSRASPGPVGGREPLEAVPCRHSPAGGRGRDRRRAAPP